jgi:hypothetical protein
MLEIALNSSHLLFFLRFLHPESNFLSLGGNLGGIDE